MRAQIPNAGDLEFVCADLTSLEVINRATKAREECGYTHESV